MDPNQGKCDGKVGVVEDIFGLLPPSANAGGGGGDGGEVKVRRFTLTNSSGAKVQVINYGATITSIQVPDRSGVMGDVVLGFDNVQGYLSDENPYLGATIGRVGNRIAGGKFTLQGLPFSLPSINNGPNHLHGGHKGFDKRMWEARVEEGSGAGVVMSYLSPDGEEGYPGHCLINVRFEWTEECELKIEYKATTTAPTPINLTNHSYFNLKGHGSGGLEGHWIQLNADHYTPVDGSLIPTGEIAPVQGNPLMDLRRPSKSLTQLLDSFSPPGPHTGYDHNFCLNRRSANPNQLTRVAMVEESGSGRVMLVTSDQPGVQFYTANFFPAKGSDGGGGGGIKGKAGAQYHRHGGFCLETQNYPDAINHSNFPSVVLLPGEVYSHRVIFHFGTTPLTTPISPLVKVIQ